jgi:hypothetical protein
MLAPKADIALKDGNRKIKGNGSALGNLLLTLLDRAREVNRLGDDHIALEAFLKQMQKASTYIPKSLRILTNYTGPC